MLKPFGSFGPPGSPGPGGLSEAPRRERSEVCEEEGEKDVNEEE